MSVWLKLVALVVVVMTIPFGLAACGGGDDSEPSGSDPTTTEAAEVPGGTSPTDAATNGSGNDGEVDSGSPDGSGSGSSSDGDGNTSSGSGDSTSSNPDDADKDGGSGDPAKQPDKTDPTNTPGKVAGTVAAALKAKDANSLCQSLAPSYIQKTSKSVDGCVKTFERLLKAANSNMISGKAGKVRRNGAQRANAQLLRPNGKTAGAIQLVRENGRWYVTLDSGN